MPPRHMTLVVSHAHVQVAITDVPSCGAVHYAYDHGIDVQVYPPREQIASPSSTETRDRGRSLGCEDDLVSSLKELDIDFVLLAGYLKLVPSGVVAAFDKRMLNIHPGLLPAFGGKGMYGKHVHSAVISSGSRCVPQLPND
jgi:phosphoribosylglycinamide formyltransferase